jgi:neutral ceramidase
MVLITAFLACSGGGDPPPFDGWPELVPGAPVAGAAEWPIDVPVGGPMGGYSSRCGYLGGTSAQDRRQSQYTVNWAESTGVHTRQQIKVIWLENGDDHLVLAKADIIYSYDGLVDEITTELETATGLDLEGKVVLASSHTHHGIANFSDQYHFYLGGDLYNPEVFERFKASAVGAALEAYDTREPVAIGAGWAREWDPDGRVYRDRRGENNDLAIEGWDDMVGMGKDEYLHVLRIDRLDGTPLAMTMTFGMHGTSLGGDQSMISTDSTGGLETGIEEAFDSEVMVMHLQGAGGDASPAGRDDDFARLETIGEYARPLVMALYDQVPVSSDPISMETASRHITQVRDDIRVTRNGLVDWYYPPFDPDYTPDNVIYDDVGKLMSPFDEFNTQYGGAFCGSEIPLIPGFSIGTEVFPYSGCVDVEAVSAVLLGIFGLDSVPLPMPEGLEAGTTASRIGPLLTLNEDGSITSQDLLAGFFPGETTAMYTEQFRRRVRDEIGDEMALVVGYAQDHEGYFLIPEDWLLGGYEPEINIWGPLQGEHVMEGVLEYADSVLSTPWHEPEDPFDQWPQTVYPDKDLPGDQPDVNPEAGTLITEPSDDFWVPLDLVLALEMPAQLPRVQGTAQLAWYGGDPAVDMPRVSVERQEGDGSWVAVTSHSGRPITDTMGDVLLAWTPDPLKPVQDPQVHQWWASWQVVGHVHDRTGVPAGTYRLRAEGRSYTGGDATWPWTTEDYSVTSEPFEVVPVALTVALAADGLDVWIDGPLDGYRLIDLEGASRGANPVRGSVTLDWSDGSQDVIETTLSGAYGHVSISVPGGATSVTVTDQYGNSGSVDF